MRRLVFIAVMLAITALHAQQMANSILEQIYTEKIALEHDIELCDSLISRLMETDQGFAEQDMFETNRDYLSRITSNAHRIIGLRKQYTLNHLSILDSLREVVVDEQIAINMQFIDYDRNTGMVQLEFRSPDYPFFYEYEGPMESDFARYIYNNPDSLTFDTMAYIGDGDELALHLVIINSPSEWYQIVFDSSARGMSGIKACYSDDGRYMAYYDYRNDPNTVQLRHDNWVSRVNVGAQVTCISLSPDGKYLALGIHATPANSTDFWVLETEDNSIVLTGSVEGGVTSVDISPDGRLLAVGGGYTFVASTAQIFEIQTGSMLFDFSDHSVISAVKFSPDQRYVASTGSSLAVWDLSTLEKYIYEGSSDYFTCMDFHPGGTTLVTGKNNRGFQFYNLDTKEVHSYEGELDVHFLCFDYQGRYLLVGGTETKVINMDTFTYSEVWEGSNSLYRPGFARVMKIHY